MCLEIGLRFLCAIDRSHRPPSSSFPQHKLNGKKLTDAPSLAALSESLGIVLSPATAKRAATFARSDTRALSRSSSRRPGARGDDANPLLASLMDTYTNNDVLSIEQSIAQHVEYTLARSRTSFDSQEAYLAAGYSLRDRLIEAWNDTNVHFKDADPKR